jgi:hypothetical protein
MSLLDIEDRFWVPDAFIDKLDAAIVNFRARSRANCATKQMRFSKGKSKG